jgi:hypothetical protein
VQLGPSPVRRIDSQHATKYCVGVCCHCIPTTLSVSRHVRLTARPGRGFDGSQRGPTLAVGLEQHHVFRICVCPVAGVNNALCCALLRFSTNSPLTARREQLRHEHACVTKCFSSAHSQAAFGPPRHRPALAAHAFLTFGSRKFRVERGARVPCSSACSTNFVLTGSGNLGSPPSSASLTLVLNWPWASTGGPAAASQHQPPSSKGRPSSSCIIIISKLSTNSLFTLRNARAWCVAPPEQALPSDVFVCSSS